MYEVLCNGSVISTKITQQEAQAMADERKLKFPKSAYEVRQQVEPVQTSRYVWPERYQDED